MPNLYAPAVQGRGRRPLDQGLPPRDAHRPRATRPIGAGARAIGAQPSGNDVRCPTRSTAPTPRAGLPAPDRDAGGRRDRGSRDPEPARPQRAAPLRGRGRARSATRSRDAGVHRAVIANADEHEPPQVEDGSQYGREAVSALMGSGGRLRGGDVGTDLLRARPQLALRRPARPRSGGVPVREELHATAASCWSKPPTCSAPTTTARTSPTCTARRSPQGRRPHRPARRPSAAARRPEHGHRARGEPGALGPAERVHRHRPRLAGAPARPADLAHGPPGRLRAARRCRPDDPRSLEQSRSPARWRAGPTSATAPAGASPPDARSSRARTGPALPRLGRPRPRRSSSAGPRSSCALLAVVTLARLLRNRTTADRAVRAGRCRGSPSG